MRTIREAETFAKKLKELGVDPKRMDELLEGITLTVATHPEIFEKLPGKELRRFRIPPFPGMPQLNVWFKYDDNNVDFLEIDILEDTTKYAL